MINGGIITKTCNYVNLTLIKNKKMGMLYIVFRVLRILFNIYCFIFLALLSQEKKTIEEEKFSIKKNQYFVYFFESDVKKFFLGTKKN